MTRADPGLPYIPFDEQEFLLTRKAKWAENQLTHSASKQKFRLTEKIKEAARTIGDSDWPKVQVSCEPAREQLSSIWDS